MSVLKVFDMMAGGIEFNHYFVEKEIAMPELARFIVFSFIIVMSLSLMNLLVSTFARKASEFRITRNLQPKLPAFADSSDVENRKKSARVQFVTLIKIVMPLITCIYRNRQLKRARF